MPHQIMRIVNAAPAGTSMNDVLTQLQNMGIMCDMESLRTTVSSLEGDGFIYKNEADVLLPTN